MKIYLVFTSLLFSSLIFSNTLESVPVDTNFTLYDLEDSMVDNEIEILLPSQRKPNRKAPNQMLPHDLTPATYGDYKRPYDSTQHLNPRLSALIFAGCMLFIAYVGIRVRKSLKKDKKINVNGKKIT